jgi:hypothetical protein
MVVMRWIWGMMGREGPLSFWMEASELTAT